jgi:[acyl-carrier-protein] S-malonyltransferase
MKTMLVFPGQGSQYPGMGKDIFDNYECSRKVFSLVSDELNKDIADLAFNGKDEEIKKSYNTQPLLMTVSVATYLAMEKEYGEKINNLNICGVAGHSLGEYSALCVSNCLSIKNTAKILFKRGKAMYECVNNDTGMLAVIGSDNETIQQNINKIKPNCLVIANSNSIGQTVVSGYLEDIEKFKIEMANQAKQLIQLPVSGAFHSPLMQKAQDIMEHEIDNLDIQEPKYQILQNYSGRFEKKTSDIKFNLKKQITAPILWCENIRYAISNGFDTFIEIGAKNVLSKLIKRTIKKEEENKIKILNIENTENIKTLFEYIEK